MSDETAAETPETPPSGGSPLKRRLQNLRRRPVALGLAAVLAVAALGIGGFALLQPESTAQPNAVGVVSPESADPSDSSAPETTPSEKPEPIGPVTAADTLAASQPTSLRIPAIGVSSPTFKVGLNADDTMEVPQPGPDYDKAAWYKFSPTPGEVGPSVIIGHIDSAENGPSVFYDLDKLQPGDKVAVTRQDGTVAVFEIDKVQTFPKSDFPTELVYGDTSKSELRLITCGGVFDDAANNYVSNIVAFGHLLGSTKV